MPHCADASDEDVCGLFRKEIDNSIRLPPPALIQFDGRGATFVRPLNSSGVSGSSVCPETHFQCPDNGYCLPVFVLCNGVYDCPGHEDEVHCDSYKCPGFYRCRGSTVCVHANELCDGVYQCPQRDDEWLCNAMCPQSCTCYGLAFVCRDLFPVSLYPQLRYLDARGSGLNYPNSNNSLLIYLSLARCGVIEVTELSLPNLLTLDLSDNHLTSITDQHLSRLPNLRHLMLANNPLTSVFRRHLASRPLFPNLRTLDLSGVSLPEMDVSALNVFPSLNTLNLSHCGVDRVLGDGFQALQQLRVLDLRGCPLTLFPRGVFDRLDDLQAVFADNYKLCCPATLPLRFNPANCKAPSDVISSCQSLLRSNIYRVVLSVFAVLAVAGNAVVIFAEVAMSEIKHKLGFVVFVANLCISNFVMGIYMTVVSVADRHYLGTYLWNDVTWRNSADCKTAGFLFLMSSVVSAFIVCLITLDRFLVLHFPASQLRFNRNTAVLASALAWTAGLTIATVRLLFHTSHWRVYSQTGICVPLPFTRKDFAGRNDTFQVMVVLNLVLFVLVALGQVFIYWSVQKKAMSASHFTGNAHNDLILARRFLTVAVSNCLCWVPVGVLELLSWNGIPTASEVRVATAILVLLLNPAINPFLYTLNVVLGRRRQQREDRLKQFLLSRVNTQEADIDNSVRLCNVTQDDALYVFKQWLSKGVLPPEHASECLLARESPEDQTNFQHR